MTNTVEISGARDRLYLVERGVFDDRARLAFTNGQCHGLALALHRRTGLPLVAIEDAHGVCQHICIRGNDGRLIDIRGAHNPDSIVPSGGSTRAVDNAYIDQLERNRGWAQANRDAADAWVDGVLVRAEVGAPDPAPSGFTTAGDTNHGYAVRVDWLGEAHMDVYVRRSGADAQAWAFFAHVLLPVDEETGRHVIDFTADSFNRLARQWVVHQFDPRKAERKLRAEGM